MSERAQRTLPPQPPAQLPGRLPRALRVALLVTAVEALALALVAVGLAAYQASGHRPHDALDAWFVVGLAAFGALALGFTARGLAHTSRWSRSPTVLTQLILVPVGIETAVGGAPWIGVPLAVAAAAGLVGLFAPSTTRRLFDG